MLYKAAFDFGENKPLRHIEAVDIVEAAEIAQKYAGDEHFVTELVLLGFSPLNKNVFESDENTITVFDGQFKK